MNKYAYKLDIATEKDWNTLFWLAERGYDGNILEECDKYRVWNGIDADDEDTFDTAPACHATMYFEEPSAWAVAEYVRADEHAFLSCCGSDTLIESLRGFIDAIV